MRFEIWPDERKEAEKVVRLALKEGSFGSVSVVAVDETGAELDSGCLVRFLGRRVRRVGYVDASLGFDTDGSGRIMEEE